MSVLAKKEFPRLEVVPPNQVPKVPPSLERLWTIELLYGKHSAYSQLTYAAKFTTKLTGGASATYLVIELRERFEEILRSGMAQEDRQCAHASHHKKNTSRSVRP